MHRRAFTIMQHSQHGMEDVRLHALPIGQWATVRRVLPAPDGTDDALMLRLLEIGFVPGEPVRIMASAGLRRDPLAVRVGHTSFALRRHEADRICVTPGVADAH